jgi:hypothetical protein
MLKKFVQQGRSERRGYANSVPYEDHLIYARTPLADFFSILLEESVKALPGPTPPDAEEKK